MLAIGSNNGLGHVISNSYDYSQFDLAWAAIVVLGAIGVALMGLVVLAEDRVLRWRGFR